MKQRILIVEDEAPLASGLNDLLSGEGYQPLVAADGRQALELYRRRKPDLVLLDVMLPEKSGYEVCREIRREDPRVPILMLTAKGEELDRIAGLELGADDYIVKPFGVGELLARIRAAFRRQRALGEAEAGEPEELAFADVRVDPRRLELRKAGRRQALTPRELALLRLFCSRRGEVLDRDTLLERVWGVRYEGTTRTLDQHVAQLRKKIEEDPSHPRLLLTVHGVGYRLAAEPGEAE
jgi:two-component system, OmpR family, alkaline phosphatase synthesis response regulator PhoP